MEAGHERQTIVGVGSALMDILVQEDDEFLARANAPKGGMILVDADRVDRVQKEARSTPVMVPGGSACNTIVGVARLARLAGTDPVDPRFVGRRGSDRIGESFEGGLRSDGIRTFLAQSATPTGRVLSIVSPDAQRSMLTFLGASAEFAAADLSPDQFEGASIVHIEGYLAYSPELITAVMKRGREAGARVSLDLASYTVVDACRGLLADIVSRFVDILIANEEEARAFVGESDETKALLALAARAPMAVLKIGKRGSLVRTAGVTTRIAPMGDGRVVDTTGAGDCWAAGFMFGLLMGYPVERCGILASACGWEVCRVLGAHIPDEGWERIRAWLP
ncbi:MAG: adenosine kinase [Acidobacteriota bacterium]